MSFSSSPPLVDNVQTKKRASAYISDEIRSMDGTTPSTKKKKEAPPAVKRSRWGTPVGRVVGEEVTKSGTTIKHLLDPIAERLLGADQDDVLCPLGYPAGLVFDDGTKAEATGKVDAKEADKFLKSAEKTWPSWCFLAPGVVCVWGGKVQKPKNLLPITYDGARVSTRLLIKKCALLSTETAFGRPITFETTDGMRARAAALMAMQPPVNGVGVFI